MNLLFFKNGKTHPSITVNPSPELKNLTPSDIETINIIIVEEEHKITIDFNGKYIKDMGLVKRIFAASSKSIENAKLL